MAFSTAYNISNLNGVNGFALRGGIELDQIASSLSVVDLNGDGFDDLVVGGPLLNNYAGSIFVAFGHAGAFPAALTPPLLFGAVGFRIDGVAPPDRAGFSLASGGDVDGDGREDLLIGSYYFGAPSPPGSAYLVYGQDSGHGNLNLGTMTPAQGLTFVGKTNGDQAGGDVAAAGDVNGDGFDDILIGARAVSVNGLSGAGAAYLVFGGPNIAASASLGGLTAGRGMVIEGAGASDLFGDEVAGIGDVNGDGIADFAVGSASIGLADRGAAFVVFGQAHGFPAKLDLASLNGTNGFRIDGERDGDYLGSAIAAAGDVNGDGVGDFIVCAPGRDSVPGVVDDGVGSAYVVFGTTAARPAVFNVATLNGANGFRIDGDTDAVFLGYGGAAAGDVNGDGFDDVIVGDPNARAAGIGAAGSAFVVFGKASGFAASFLANSVNGINGFRINGDHQLANQGLSVAAGDLNGDGLADVIAGGPMAITDGLPGHLHDGRALVVFGQALGVSTTGADSFTGTAGADVYNGLAGDDMLRGMGGNDVLRGGPGTDTAVFGAASANFEWWGRPDGTWKVKDLRAGAPEGTDTLTTFERLQFSDKTVKIAGLTTAEKLTDAYSNILRSTATGSELTFLNGLITSVGNASKTLGAAITEIVAKADQTTAVAAMSYQFFLNFVPSKGGFDYLVSPQGPNPNNINSAYYQSFNIENRYINFAVNLGKVGEGAPSFLAEYGGKTLFQATKDAYMEIFGGTVVDSKINTILDSSVGSMSRAQYFALYGGDGLSGIGTKAAMVGWLLTEAAKADLGMYANSSNAFLTDLADGAQTLVDVVGAYGHSGYVFNG